MGVVFWRVVAPDGDGGPDISTPTWQFTVGPRSAPVNSSWGTVLDVNGDGYADILVGAPFDTAHLYYGGPTGLSSTPITVRDPDMPPARFGTSVASAGDVNGDGFGDIVVGAILAVGNPEQPYVLARAYIYLGGASGLSTTPLRLPPPATATEDFGGSAAGIGDVDGDGYADVVVGGDGAGAHVYFGSATGPSPRATSLPMPPDEVFDGYGATLAGGDVNGDGYADIVVGAERSLENKGRANLYLGGPSGPSLSPQILEAPDGAYSYFGHSVGSAGDTNGDGYDDIIIGAQIVTGVLSRAYVYFASSSGLAASPATLLDTGAETNFGQAVAGIGDVNNDGYGDVIVGDNIGVALAGRAYVYLGSASGPVMSRLTLAGRTTSVAEGNDEFGYALAGAGDTNGDGYADVIVGSFGVNGSTGRVYIFNGNASGVSLTPASVFDRPMGSDGVFGMSVAWVGLGSPATDEPL